MIQIKKGDIIVFSVSILLALLMLLIFIFPSKSAGKVIIKQNNQTVYSDSLSKDNLVDLGTNKAVIKDKKVYMQNANCKNQVCVKSGTISKKGEIIVCAPNRIIIEIK